MLFISISHNLQLSFFPKGVQQIIHSLMYMEVRICIILTMRNKSRGEGYIAKTKFFQPREDDNKSNAYFTFHDSTIKLVQQPSNLVPSTRIKLRIQRRDKIIHQFAHIQASTHKIVAESSSTYSIHELKPAPTHIVSSKLIRYHTRSSEVDSDRKPITVIRKEKQKNEGVRGKTAQLSTRLEIRQDSKTKRNFLNQTNIQFSNKTLERLINKPKQQAQAIISPKATPKRDQLFQAWQSMDMFAHSDDLIHYTSETLQLASTSPFLTLQQKNTRHRKVYLRSKR